jgi:hypothetical protein
MRRLYKVAFGYATLLICCGAAAQQTSSHSEVFTQARPGARVDVDRSAYHQISWVVSGAPGACLLALDYSDDGMVWELGGTIPIRDCTQSGQSTVVGQRIRFVRMNLNSLSGTSAIRATYAGFQTNPGPTGTVTSVFGRTGDVIAQPGDFNVADVTGAAPLFSPNLTGSPTSATPPAGDNSNRIATTAFVDAIFATCCGGGGGGGAVTSVFGRTGAVAGQANDYNVSMVTGAAPLASPTFTGSPRAPTPTTSDNSTLLATTAWVKAQGYSTGGGGGGNATGLSFGSLNIPLGASAPTSGQFLMFDGTNIVGGTPPGGGGSGLAGCATATSGILICDVSVQGGTGTVGMLTMPYASGGLPQPPTTAVAAIAPDNTGHLFWSPGNSAPFTAIGNGGGGGGTTGIASAFQFGATTFSLSSNAPTSGQCIGISGNSVVGTACGGAPPGLGGVTVVE